MLIGCTFQLMFSRGNSGWKRVQRQLPELHHFGFTENSVFPSTAWQLQSFHSHFIPHQVYGAVARSSHSAASGAGCLPGSGIVPQTLWAGPAAGTQGTSQPCFPFLGNLALDFGITLLTLTRQLLGHQTNDTNVIGVKAFKAEGMISCLGMAVPSGFVSKKTVDSIFIRFYLFINGCLVLFFTSGNKLLFFILPGDSKPWAGSILGIF